MNDDQSKDREGPWNGEPQFTLSEETLTIIVREFYRQFLASPRNAANRPVLKNQLETSKFSAGIDAILIGHSDFSAPAKEETAMDRSTA